MAKRALLSRLSRLEIGRKPEPAKPVRGAIASLELKVGGETKRLPSPKAVKEEKIQLEKIRQVKSREKALRLIEQFREKERIERADLKDREFTSEIDNEIQRGEQAIQKVADTWKIARIGWRLVVGFTMIYFGLRGVVNLISFILYPPANAVPIRPSSIWIGVAFIFVGWFIRWVRGKLAAHDGLAWVPYARVTFLTWIPLLAFTALLFLGRMINPTAEAFIRIAWVYFYVTVMACWFYFLTVV